MSIDHKRKNDSHEDLSRGQEIQRSSNRAFGLTLAAFFLLIAIGPVLRHHSPRLWAFAPAVAFLGLGLLRPTLLAPLNTFWMWLGLPLQKIVNPIMMGVLFFAVLTPLAFIMRLLKEDPLELEWQSYAKSYWMERTPHEPKPQSMKDQF